MPEGDSLVRLAHRLRPVLAGRTLTGADPERVAATIALQQPELVGDQIEHVLGDVWQGPALDRRERET